MFKKKILFYNNIFFLMIILFFMIYFNDFIKFLIISEFFFTLVILKMNLFLNLNIINFSILIISMMIMESSLGILLIFEFILMKKFLYFNNLNLF